MLKKYSSFLFLGFYISILISPIYAMEPLVIDDEYSELQQDDLEEEGRAKKRTRTDYTAEFEPYEIDSTISNETLLEKVTADPHSRTPDSPNKKYRNALFFRIYKEPFPSTKSSMKI